MKIRGKKKRFYGKCVFYVKQDLLVHSIKKIVKQLQCNKSITINKSILHFILQDLYRPLSSDDLDSVGDSV